MPISISLVLISAFILPAFVLYEPPESGESISLKLMAVICCAAFGIAAAVLRLFGSWWRTRRLIAEWNENATPITLESASLPVFKLRHSFPVFAVVGIRRPKIYISEQVLNKLHNDEIDAVLKHELGHIAGWDNFKSLAMKMCGDILVVPIGRHLERSWSETAESAADDYAVNCGNRSTALNLASALIKIARLIPSEPIPVLPSISYVVASDESLAVRVRRLLILADREGPLPDPTREYLFPFVLLAAEILVILATDANLLQGVHNLSERILAFLE